MAGRAEFQILEVPLFDTHAAENEGSALYHDEIHTPDTYRRKRTDNQPGSAHPFKTGRWFVKLPQSAAYNERQVRGSHACFARQHG